MSTRRPAGRWHSDQVPLIGLFLVLAFAGIDDAHGGEPPPLPDFTAGDPLPEEAGHDWNLGPTGARGWMYAWRGATTASRQIRVTAVADGSPSAGILKTGDVIVGVNNRKFTADARITFARAVTEAEARAGQLILLRWRDGFTMAVAIRLAQLGRYAATAPYDCQKSERILAAGCQAIAADLRDRHAKRGHPIVRSLNALALLASGNDDYLPLVKQEAAWANTWEIREGDLHSWSAGWVTLFLAEYAVATGDDTVLPSLRRLSRAIADGQSDVGTWGHRFAYRHNGILRGYGAMNQASLGLTLALVVAREAGVKDAVVDHAIERSRRFFAFYIGKGAIPYGDHHPWIRMHDDNGKASAAAVLFDLLRSKDAVQFFSYLGTASYGVERESGHTGNFWNMLWALPGIARAGSAATGAWISETAWLLDLARTWEGTFEFLGKPGFVKGAEHQYGGWDCTGAYLVGYALPKRRTLVTGARPSVLEPVSRSTVRQLIADGRGWTPDTGAASYEERSETELFQNLASWSPTVRERAAQALAKKDGNPRSLVRRLIQLAESDRRFEQLGACAAFEHLGQRGSDGVPALIKLLQVDDYWLQVQAAEALAGIGPPARVAAPDLLQLAAAPPHPEDRRGYRQRYLAFALFDRRTGLLANSLAGIDTDRLVAGVRAVLANQDGRARSATAGVFDELDYQPLRQLLPVIYRATVEQAPSGVMFADGVRMAGLELLAKHHIAEGLPLCVQLVEPDRWGLDNRVSRCMKALRGYGTAAREMLPALRELEEQFAANQGDSEASEHLVTVRETIAYIEKTTRSPRVRSLDLPSS